MLPIPNIGPGELLLILIIALVVLGPGRLPDVASSLGKSVREFRKAATDVADAARLDAPPAQTPPAPPTTESAPPAGVAPQAAAPDASAPSEPAGDSKPS